MHRDVRWSSTVQVQIDADPKYFPNWFFKNFNFKIMLLLTKTKFNYFPNRTFDLEKLFQEQFVLFKYDLITVKPPHVYCVYHHSTIF